MVESRYPLHTKLSNICYVCQCPYIRKRIAHVLTSTPSFNGSPADADVWKLRDRLAALFTEQQPLFPLALTASDTSSSGPSALPILPFLEKFFHTSRKRRIQPGLRTFLVTCVALFSFLAALFLLTVCIDTGVAPSLGALAVLFLIALLPSLALGLYHHLRMQHLFVKLRVPGRGNAYGTISQTIILVRGDRQVHYFYRNTQGNTIQPWQETRFAIGDDPNGSDAP